MSNSMDALAGALGLDDEVDEEDYLSDLDSEGDSNEGGELEDALDQVDERNEVADLEDADSEPVGYSGADEDGYDIWNSFDAELGEGETEGEEPVVEYVNPLAALLAKHSAPEEPEDALESEESDEDDEADEDETDEDETPVDNTAVLREFDSTIPSAVEVLGTNAAQALSSEFGIDSNSYVLRHGQVTLGEIATLDPLRKSRNRSAKGLTQSVKELGIVNPIHVMVTESYSDWLAADDDEVFEGNKYVLLDGFRRMYGAIKNGISEVEAVIWEFNDPEYGNEVALVLALLINKRQRRVWEETWNLFQVLEMRSAMAPSTLEYLLELDSGDAMKLKDVAMATTYPEVWMSLLSDEKSLDQAYNQLKKLRKEEDKASMEDARGISEFEESEGIVGDHSTNDISDEEARELLEIGTGNESLEFGEDGEEMLGMNEGELQSTSERKPLDPVLRNAILRRDDFTCQTCKLGAGINSGIALGVFEIHHTTAVYTGLDASRDDTGNISEEVAIPKLLTTCSTCHKLIHLVVRQNGKLGITKEEFEELPESEQEKWKLIGKFAKVLLWAEKKSGKKAQRSEPMRLPQNKPFWEIEKENRDAIALGDQVEKYGRNYNSTVEEHDDGDGEE